MTEQLHDPQLFLRYLGLLGIEKRPPSRAFLYDVVMAHQIRIPFENVSKLYRFKHNGLRGLPRLDEHLEGIERYNFGGTCYANNCYFYLLLKYLEFDARLCGADMAVPDAHIVILVIVDGREYLVDTGYAAPFMEPLPRDLDRDFIVSRGLDRYVLRPRDTDGRSRTDLYRNGSLAHGYLVNPVPRNIEHFAKNIDDSFRDEASFRNALLLVRFFRQSSIIIRNLNLIKANGLVAEVQKLGGRDEIPGAVYKYFGIPVEIVKDVLDGLPPLKDEWID